MTPSTTSARRSSRETCSRRRNRAEVRAFTKAYCNLRMGLIDDDRDASADDVMDGCGSLVAGMLRIS